MYATHTVEQPAELLTFVFGCHPEVRRTKVRQWLKLGSIHVNGRLITRSKHLLQTGDLVSIRSPGKVRVEISLPSGLQVLFEDASLIVIEKPAGLLSMASATQSNRTAYACLTEFVRRGNSKSRERVWIVHRLDRETSGLMVFAKTETAKRAMQSHWSEVRKKYLAVVEGSPPDDQGKWSSHLDESGPFKVFSAPASGRTRLAVTHYQVLKRNSNRALVELTPETGRRNQIRVHLADASCPVVGDRKYLAQTDPANRLGLHASLLEFKHPLTGRLLLFESPLPRELSRLL